MPTPENLFGNTSPSNLTGSPDQPNRLHLHVGSSRSDVKCLCRSMPILGSRPITILLWLTSRCPVRKWEFGRAVS